MIEVQTMQPQQQGEASSHHHHHHHHQVASPSPSFSSYSSETLAEIAARVIEELRRNPHSVSDDDALFLPWEENDDHNFTAPRDDRNDDDAIENGDDDDFEFAFVSRDPNTSPVSADDIFYNGQIRPMYPIFDRNLLFSGNDLVDSVSPTPNTTQEAVVTRQRRLPLRKLMFEERETGSCSSSTSEADDSVDLEGVAEGTYCVWTPNSVGRERKKSNSTGSASKRWKLRNLLLRSHSEGKDKQPLVFQIPTKRANNKVAAAKPGSGDGNGGASVEHDGKNRTVGTVGKDHHEDQTRRTSFLPYRPELVGLFANVNGLGRNLNPF